MNEELNVNPDIANAAEKKWRLALLDRAPGIALILFILLLIADQFNLLPN